MTTSAPLARTPLHHWHTAHGARFIERDGWLVVADYGSPAVAGTGLGLMDASAFAKMSVRGPGVASFARVLAPDSAALHPLGVAFLPADRLLACRLTEDHLLILVSSTAPAALEVYRALLNGLSVVRTDETSAYAGFRLLGDDAEEVLRRLTHLDVRPVSLAAGSCAETALAGVEALLVRPVGSPAELQVYAAWDVAEYLWERIWEAGQEWRIRPLGLEALALRGAKR